ncbi:unnamed protein product [Enterobius vermicularis]|uniref:Progestin and adipoQ receptor family member 3 n=1 Tax=Enterobius vermicularis TaxID=51028 RepID=A0A0N4UTX0_ENTVE|nr:unnamed protein product [Enterobius vermicularis]
MLLSTSYHLFGCSSKSSRQKWLRCDIFGITAGLIGMYTVGIYSAFYCFEQLRTNYFTMLMGLFAISAYMPSCDNFMEPKIFGGRIGYLHLTYIAIVAFGVCPTAHWVTLHGGLQNEHVAAWLPKILLLYILTGSGFFFYASMVPERFKPGVFDIFGSSHQWWHMLIFAAMFFWFRSGIDLLTFYRTLDTDCPVMTQQFNQTYLQLW